MLKAKSLKMVKLFIFQVILFTLFLFVDGGTYLQIDFTSYQNPNSPDRALPGQYSCLYSPGGSNFDGCDMCHVQFTTIISYLDYSKPFTYPSKLWDLKSTTATYNETVPQKPTTTNSRPTAVLVSVSHFGCITKSNQVDNCVNNGCTPSGVMLMETFYWNLTGVVPDKSSSTAQSKPISLTGDIQQTTLNFNYKFYCDGNSGPNCDLKCDPTNGSFQRCTSTTNKANYSCSVLSDGQVTNCTECLEFSANFTCTKPATCSPLPIVTESSGKKDFRTATIVLGVFLGLAFIVLLVLLALYCFTDIPDKYSRRNRAQWSRTGPQQSQKPLINAQPPMTNAIKNQRNGGDYNSSNGFPKPLPTFIESKVNSDSGMARIPRRSIDSDTSIPDPGYAATIRPAPLPPYNHIPPNAKPESYRTDNSSQGSAQTPTKRSREVQV